jgi:hypothetical protein
MENRAARRLLVGLALVLVAWGLLAWHRSDTRRIRRNLSRIQRLVAKAPGEGDLAGLAKARKIADLFSDPFDVRAEPVGFGTTDRGRLISGIHQYRSRSETLLMQVSGEELYFDQERTGATSYLTAEFINDLGDFAGTESYSLKVHWVRAEGEWRIGRVEVQGVSE